MSAELLARRPVEIERPRRSASRRVPVVVGLGATLLLLPTLFRTEIFVDEGATLFSSRLSLPELWAQSQAQDVVFLPYYLVMKLWLLPGDSLVWAR